MAGKVKTEAVWSLLSSKLRSFIRARVEDDQTAEDLLQDVFVRIHERLGTLNDEQRLDAWVFQIARNRIIDHYRTRKALEPIPEASGRLHATGDGDTQALNQQVAGWLPSMIDELPEKYRDAVRMFELHGISQAEIARRLGISISGAKSRVQRGREHLKHALNRCCKIDLDRRGNVLDFRPRQDGCEHCGETLVTVTKAPSPDRGSNALRRETP